MTSPRKEATYDGLDNLSGSGHPLLKTETDLKEKFDGAGFTDESFDKDLTLGEALRKDADKVKKAFNETSSGFKSSVLSLSTPGGLVTGLTSIFPVIRTLRTYKPEFFFPDLGAGLVEGIMKVPSGLAYAALAGMPAQYGLYTSLLPPFIYMCMGTCTQISFGVTAIEALFLGESVRGIIGDEAFDTKKGSAAEQAKVEFVLFFSFLVGIWQLIFRIFRLDFISTLLADPVLSGFSTGGAFIIATSQLPSMLNIKMTHSNDEFLPAAWKEAIQMFDDWNWCSIGFCVTAMVTLVILQFLTKKFLNNFPIPWQFLIVILSIVITKSMDLVGTQGLKVLGTIPKGFPEGGFPYIPNMNDGESKSELFVKTLFPSFLCALFVYVMSLSLGTLFAGKNGYKVKPRQELLTIGTSNTLASMCGAFICSASFSRTAVVHDLKGKTVMHGCPALIIVILTVTLLTEQMYYLPKTILAAIIILAVWPMLEFRHGVRYYCLDKVEFAIWFFTFLMCLFEGAMIGIYTGVGLSILVMVWRTARPKTVVLGRLPGTTIYRDLRRFPLAEEVAGVKIIRFDGSLNFCNYAVFADSIEAVINPDIHTVVVDASSINSLDTSSIRATLELIQSFNKQGVSLIFANWKGPQRDLMARAHFYNHVKENTLFLALHDAVTFAKKSGPRPTSGKTLVEVDGYGEEVKWKVALSPKTSA